MPVSTLGMHDKSLEMWSTFRRVNRSYSASGEALQVQVPEAFRTSPLLR